MANLEIQAQVASLAERAISYLEQKVIDGKFFLERSYKTNSALCVPLGNVTIAAAFKESDIGKLPSFKRRAPMGLSLPASCVEVSVPRAFDLNFQEFRQSGYPDLAKLMNEDGRQYTYNPTLFMNNKGEGEILNEVYLETRHRNRRELQLVDSQAREISPRDVEFFTRVMDQVVFASIDPANIINSSS